MILGGKGYKTNNIDLEDKTCICIWSIVNQRTN